MISRWWLPNRAARRPCAVLLVFFASLSIARHALSAEPQWKIQFLYDHAGSNFAIEDIHCPTARHCVAAGSIDDRKGHDQGAVVVSSDAGAHWSQYDVKERPISLYFLNESLGWMVTDHGLWSTVEGGRSWTKIDSRKGILETWFLEPDHGYIVGLKGLLEETRDGAKSWTRVNAPVSVSDSRDINYDIIAFQANHGVIVGAPSQPPTIRDKTQLTVLETLDGGKKWNAGAIPLTGDLAQLRMSKQGFVFSLILYSDPKYPVASAIFKTPLGSPSGQLIFAEPDRAVTDIALLPNGGAVLATVEPPGNTTQVPIPGKLKMFETRDLKIWEEIPVDYRAQAQRAVISAPDSANIWVATDTGAILKLSE